MITEKHMEESKMSKIGIIISREYSTRVKKKSFIISTLLVPFLLAMMIVVPMLIAMYSSDNKTYNIAVSDESGVVADKLEMSERILQRVTPITDCLISLRWIH